MKSSVRICCRAEHVGTDHFVLAKLFELLLRRKGYQVKFEILPAAIVAWDYLEISGFEARPEGELNVQMLRGVVREMNLSEVIRSDPFADILIGSTSVVRGVLDRMVRDLKLNLGRVVDEHFERGDYEGPACLGFQRKAVEFSTYLEGLVQSRLSGIVS